MTPNLVSREDWLNSRMALLEREKAFTKERDALSRARRDLPMVEVTKDYEFQTENGAQSLSDLFDGKGQLAVYHFMYGPDSADGCPSCSFFCDGFERTDIHLAARDTAFVVASDAPLDTLQAYRARMGWSFKWVSAMGNEFGSDMGVTFTKDEMEGRGYNYGKQPYAQHSPGISIFAKFADGTIAHSYSSYGRGLDILNPAYNMLDMTPKGRDEADLAYPMAWVRRRDQYEI